MFWKIFDALEDWFMVLSLGIMLILNFANVVSRYLLSSTLSFTEEITTNLFVWSCFIGASAAAKRGAHLGFDLVVMNLPKKTCSHRQCLGDIADLEHVCSFIYLEF